MSDYTLSDSDKDIIESHMRSVGSSLSLNEWISEAISEKIYNEQQEYEKLSPGRKWYRSEEGKKAIEKLRSKGKSDYSSD